MSGGSWSRDQVDRTIEVYFSMLELELDGEAFSKTAYRRELCNEIHRTEGSVEYKMQNISAVLAELGAKYVNGYKPARNVQGLLRERVTERFEGAGDLRRLMIRVADEPPSDEAVELGEPSELPTVRLENRSPDRGRRPRMVNYQEREALNRALGRAGEDAVVRMERRRLMSGGARGLADRVRHVSVEDGDGLGYDVLSFSMEGAERYIEVKTTRDAKEMPFLVSRNEVDFSVAHPERFCLYRLFRFGEASGGYYRLPGSLASSADLDPELYRGLPVVEVG